MRYLQITATVAATDAEPAADLLRSLTGAGVWVETPFTQPDVESDAVVDRCGRVRVHGYARDGAPGALDAARARFAAAGLDADLACDDVDEEDWAESWKEHFQVERYGRRLVVVPSWRTHAAAPDDVVITLDPGMAFGTGQHETTRMCLEALERAVRPGDALLDVGCGSGILAIAGAKLGARQAVALDIDPECVRVTRENARANGMDAVVDAGCGSVGQAWPFDTPAAGRFDVVVANIVARVLIELAGPLVRAVRPAGRLIASGVIREREREVLAALAAAGAHVREVRAMGEWRCIEAARGGGA